MMNVFPTFSLDYIMGLEWDTFFYWHRRALEIKYGKDIPETETLANGKVDDETFERQKQKLYAKLEAEEKANEGTING